MSKGKKKRTALGDRLRTLRRYNGMTQREVAARLHLERSSYAYYEIGTTEPDLHTLIEIATIFRVSTDFLLGRGEYTISVESIRWVPVPAFPAAGAPNKKAPPDP